MQKGPGSRRVSAARKADGIILTHLFPKWNRNARNTKRQRKRNQPGECQNQSSEQSFASVDPAYLFACALSWRAGHTPAGWELIRCIRDQPGASWIASELLRDLGPAGTPAVEEFQAANESAETGKAEAGAMKTPYGLEIIENCVTCNLRKDKWFCGLSPEVLRAFSAAGHLSTYPNGAVLFVEGQVPRGAFVLCSGRVKLSTTSRDGRVLILKVAEPGETLGLSAVIGGTPYELTAETSGPCQVKFIERTTLLKLIERYGELGLHASQALSREFQSAYRDIHELVLSRSSTGKLARLLLSWTSGREKEREIKIRSSLTHEEMAQMIGSSRETVTRLLSDLKKRELIRLEGSTLVIQDRSGLEALAA
jgi:CRP/FNR family transcriptional regulator, cyclic AMP receptor protein